MKKIFFGLLLTSIFLFSSCDFMFDTAYDIAYDLGIFEQDNTTGTVKERAFRIAEKFVREQTQYVSGATGRQVYPFDCSGFVARCYYDAMLGTDQKLPWDFNRKKATAQEIHDKYSRPVNNPEKGDLIFLNFSGGSSISHIGIFQKKDLDGTIHFIDATDYWNYNKVVDYRTLKPNRRNEVFRGFGEMIIY